MASSRKKPSPDGLAGRLACWLSCPLPDLAQQVQGRPVHLCVALSGGLDSIVLLDLLARLRTSTQPAFNLSALHVHHGLQPCADDWVLFVQQQCASRDVACAVMRVQVAQDAGKGIEAAARNARYAAFACHAASVGVDAFVLAQHRSDQAETVLHHLLRGNGLAGLAAMPAVRTLPGASAKLWRPLLTESRATLAAWAEKHGLEWVDDPSNADQRYTRNAIRHAILPVLAGHFPAAEATLARVAAHAGEAAALLADLAVADMIPAVQDGWYEPAQLASLPERRQRNALRHWLRQQGMVCEADAFENLWVSLAGLDNESALELSVGGYVLRSYRRRLCVTPASLSTGSSYVLAGSDNAVAAAMAREHGWSLGIVWQWRRGGLPVETLAGGMRVRLRRAGEHLRSNGMGRDFKKLCQQAGIPAWQRALLPSLEIDGRLAAIAGVGVDDMFAAAHGWWPGLVWVSAGEG